MSHFLFISIDYVAEYTGYGIFFQEEHLFCGFGKGKNLREASDVMGRDIFDGFYDRFYMDIVSDTFRLEIFSEFFLQKPGGSSSGKEDIFEEKLFGDVGRGDEYRIEEESEK